jgi:5-methylcytosine-specific restriction endonuclease McrA
MESTTSPQEVSASLNSLSDDELAAHVKHLAACERRASVALVRSLVEFDTRRLYLREGCSSLFAYCVRVLHLSEGAAYNRIETARAARRFPKLLHALECGDLTLTAIRLLAPYLTAENYEEVMVAARHRSKRQIEELIAKLNPRQAEATLVRRLRSATTTPLSPELYLLQVTLTRETHDKLRRAQALARHTVPLGDVGAILDRALTLLIEHIERQRFAAVASPRPRSMKATAAGRHIPAAVRRAVWERDEGSCAFVGSAGRCGETAFLEFHHVDPYAAGGAATVDNIQLRCRAHNQYEARVFFGDMLAREPRAPWNPATALPSTPFPVHECERRQEVRGVSSRLDNETPMSLRRTDESEQGSLVIDRAAEMLPPEEWRIERPYWTTGNLEPVMFANYGPDG